MKIIKITIWIVIAVLLILYSCGCENQELGAGGTSCTYSGSGDWYINSSDNCVISTDTYVNGNVNLLNTGSGLLYIIDGATLACENINSTSTNIDVEAGSHIKLWNDS